MRGYCQEEVAFKTNAHVFDWTSTALALALYLFSLANVLEDGNYSFLIIDRLEELISSPADRCLIFIALAE